MSDVPEPVRPQTGRAILRFAGVVVGLVAIGWIGLSVLDWWWTRKQERLREEVKPLVEEAQNLREHIQPILARLHDHARKPSATDESIECPSVHVPVPLVQHSTLARLVKGDSPHAREAEGPWYLSSAAFGYLTGAVTPAADNPETYRRRNETYRVLADTRLIAVFYTVEFHAPKPQGSKSFTGGTVTGWAVVHDAKTGEPICSAHVHSEPVFAVSTSQSTTEEEDWAQGQALHDAVESAFWGSASAALGMELSSPRLRP